MNEPWKGENWLKTAQALEEHSKDFRNSKDEFRVGQGSGFTVAIGALWAALKEDWKNKSKG